MSDLDDFDFGLDDDDEHDALGITALIPQALSLIAEREYFSATTIAENLNLDPEEAESLCAALEVDGYCTAPAGKYNRRKGLAKARKEAPKGMSVTAASDATILAALERPVSVTFLSQALRMTTATVKRKVRALPPIRYHRKNQPLYDFRQAVMYLVPPKVDVAEYVRKMGVGDLPQELQKDVWDARLKEQKWRKAAGELWETDDVLDVLGDAFQRLKTTTQLWADHISDDFGLAPEVRDALVEKVDELNADLHRALVKMPKDRETKSQLGNYDGDDDDG